MPVHHGLDRLDQQFVQAAVDQRTAWRTEGLRRACSRISLAGEQPLLVDRMVAWKISSACLMISSSVCGSMGSSGIESMASVAAFQDRASRLRCTTASRSSSLDSKLE
jgi:hypothetical protein